MDYPLILNDIIRLGAHPSDFFHRAKHLNLNYSKERLDFILSLAQESALLSIAGKGWRRGKNFEDLLKGNVSKYWKILYETFLTTDAWDELPLVVKLKAIGNRETPSNTRRLIINNLREGDKKAECIERIRTSFPDFYRKGGLWKLRRERREPTWEELEEPLIRLILKELEWLNLLRSGEVIEFTPSGKEIINGKELKFFFEKPVVKPDYEIIAGIKTHPRDLFFLERIAEPISCDGIYIYRISKETVISLIEKGFKANEILKSMESWGDLPDNLRENIKIWGARFTKIKLRFGIMVEFENSYLMKEVLKLEGMKEILKPVGERFAIARIEDIEKLKRLLKAGDYFAEIPDKWNTKKILYLNKEEREVLKKVLQDATENLKFPFNVIIEEIIERL